jgi:hypothetical protein
VLILVLLLGAKVQNFIFKTMLATIPKPPYYAVIFTSIKTDDDRGYSLMSDFLF